MVLPVALCAPCVASAASVAGQSLFPIASAAVMGARHYSKKNKKTKKRKNKTKQRKKKSKQRGGSPLKKDMKKIRNKSGKCRKKCSKDICKIKLKKQRFTRSRSLNKKKFDRFEGLSPQEKKQWNKERVERNRCWSKCDKLEKEEIKIHKKNFSKEYREINKENAKNCCKCKYVKTGKTFRKVRGPWSHCSYDMTNCCKR